MSEHCELYRSQVDAFMQSCLRENSRLNPTERFLWITLHGLMSDNGGEPVAMTGEQLMLHTGIRSRTTLRKAVRKLEKHGLLTVSPARGHNASAYMVIVPDQQTETEVIAEQSFTEVPEEAFRQASVPEGPVLSRSGCAAAAPAVFADTCAELRSYYNSHRNNMRECRSINEGRKMLIKKTLCDYSMDEVKEAIRTASASDWLNGKGTDRNGKSIGWKADFEWVLKNVARILEGTFENREDESPSFFDTVAAELGSQLFGQAAVPALGAGA